MGSENMTPEELWSDVYFRMVYINANWTSAQFTVRTVFSVLSVVIILVYNSRILCCIHDKHRD